MKLQADSASKKWVSKNFLFRVRGGGAQRPKITKNGRKSLQWGSENRTCPPGFQMVQSWQFMNGPVFEWSNQMAIRSVFECPVFGSPLYFEIGESATVDNHEWRLKNLSCVNARRKHFIGIRIMHQSWYSNPGPLASVPEYRAEIYQTPKTIKFFLGTVSNHKPRKQCFNLAESRPRAMSTLLSILICMQEHIQISST